MKIVFGGFLVVLFATAISKRRTEALMFVPKAWKRYLALLHKKDSVAYAFIIIDCAPKRKHDDADLEHIFKSPKGNTYNIIDVLLETHPKCVKGVERTKEEEAAKKAKYEEATTSQAEHSTAQEAMKSKSEIATTSQINLSTNGPKSPYILKVDLEQYIDNEVNFLTTLGRRDGFPEIIEHGEMPREQNSAVYKYYIMTRFGTDLLDHFNKNKADFTLTFIRDIALESLDHLQAMHAKNFAYRDLKPDNMCLTQIPGKKYNVSFIDFGYTRPIVDKGNGWFVEEESKVGTFDYMSRAAHEYDPLSAQSDIESLALVILLFIRGKLPWSINEDEGNDGNFDVEALEVESVNQKHIFWNNDDDTHMKEVLTNRGSPFLPFFRAVKNLVPGQPVNHENLRQILAQIRFPAP